jgi:mRNA-degrading endonuclease RelE of RelBE toxin-antitoxin system
MRALLHPKTAKEFKGFNRQTKAKLKKKLQELEEFPERGKPLKHSHFRSLRAGDYRAIYEMQQERVVVLFVDHRKKVYSDFRKLF